ncbi:beta-ketoacyl synthase [Streptomyces sp. DH12]|uniref:beta-ketoacyl-[acyl-carrier-protein] synthase family protein n=1 Tax=Streptomyces sp. DH12 TaxID=2857010 RepID=UPI001E53A313|nr:beta-ketoacyl-[acyl-carrier-protein] synthase family protein [Streptomyces sp. DH12]
MTSDVAITGIGLLTPAGVGTRATWEGLRTGRSFAATDPLLEGLPVDFSCAVAGFDPYAHLDRSLVRRTDPFAHLALVAARQAAEEAGLDGRVDPARVGVILGVGSNSLLTYVTLSDHISSGRARLVSPLSVPRSVPNMAAGEVATHLDCRGPAFTVASACASGNHALGVARDLLRSGACDVVLAGGAESGRSQITAVSFARARALSTRRHDPAGASRPFDRDREGFVLGEGAAVLVLERPAHARARGARVRAYLAGYGASTDAFHFAGPHPEGRGLHQAVTTALADARLDAADIDHVTAHATGTPVGDLVEARTLRRLFPGGAPPVTALKGALGHGLGAAAAVQAACAVLSLEHQEIPPTVNLDEQDPEIDLDVVTKAPRPARLRTVLGNACGFGGMNAVVVLRAP